MLLLKEDIPHIIKSLATKTYIPFKEEKLEETYGLNLERSKAYDRME